MCIYSKLYGFYFDIYIYRTLITWGVSKCNQSNVFGKSSNWIPLKILTCGTAPISTISTDHTRLLAAGNEAGDIRVWETCEESTGRGGLDGVGGPGVNKYPYFDSATGSTIAYPISSIEDSLNSTSLSQPTNAFRPDDLRVSFSGRAKGKITSILLVHAFYP